MFSQPAKTCSAQTSASVRACLESAAPAGCPPRPGESHGPALRQCLDVVGPERASGLGELALESGKGLQFPSGNTRGTLPGCSGGVSVTPAELRGRSGGSFPALGPELRGSTAGTHPRRAPLAPQPAPRCLTYRAEEVCSSKPPFAEDLRWRAAAPRGLPPGNCQWRGGQHGHTGI